MVNVFRVLQKAPAELKRLLEVNPEDEVYLKVKIDGADNLVSKISDNIWSFASPRLGGQGQHMASLTLLLQNKRLARTVEGSVGELNEEIHKIDGQLTEETDPELISDLTKKRQDLLSKIAALEYNLEISRTPIGAAANEIFYSN